MHSGYGKAFDGKGTWSFGNDYARNNLILSVNNSSSSPANKCKKVKEIHFVLMEALVHQRKGLLLTLLRKR